MDKIENLALINITIAKDLNFTKIEAIKNLEAKLNECPETWRKITEKFISSIKRNIIERGNLIEALKNSVDKVSMDSIIVKLQELDKKDNVASDFYEAAMSEME